MCNIGRVLRRALMCQKNKNTLFISTSHQNALGSFINPVVAQARHHRKTNEKNASTVPEHARLRFPACSLLDVKTPIQVVPVQRGRACTSSVH